jgi:hypothetical protein
LIALRLSGRLPNGQRLVQSGLVALVAPRQLVAGSSLAPTRGEELATSYQGEELATSYQGEELATSYQGEELATSHQGIARTRLTGRPAKAYVDRPRAEA